MSAVIVYGTYSYWGKTEYFHEPKHVFGLRSRIHLNENHCNGQSHTSVICPGRWPVVTVVA